MFTWYYFRTFVDQIQYIFLIYCIHTYPYLSCLDPYGLGKLLIYCYLSLLLAICPIHFHFFPSLWFFSKWFCIFPVFLFLSGVTCPCQCFLDGTIYVSKLNVADPPPLSDCCRQFCGLSAVEEVIVSDFFLWLVDLKNCMQAFVMECIKPPFVFGCSQQFCTEENIKMVLKMHNFV